MQSRNSCGRGGNISWRRAFVCRNDNHDEKEIDFKHSGVGFEVEESHGSYARGFSEPRDEWARDDALGDSCGNTRIVLGESPC